MERLLTVEWLQVLLTSPTMLSRLLQLVAWGSWRLLMGPCASQFQPLGFLCSLMPLHSQHLNPIDFLVLHRHFLWFILITTVLIILYMLKILMVCKALVHAYCVWSWLVGKLVIFLLILWMKRRKPSLRSHTQKAVEPHLNLRVLTRSPHFWPPYSVVYMGQEDPLETEMAMHSNILAWEIPWTEKPGRLQLVRLQKLDTTKLLSTCHL